MKIIKTKYTIRNFRETSSCKMRRWKRNVITSSRETKSYRLSISSSRRLRKRKKISSIKRSCKESRLKRSLVRTKGRRSSDSWKKTSKRSKRTRQLRITTSNWMLKIKRDSKSGMQGRKRYKCLWIEWQIQLKRRMSRKGNWREESCSSKRKKRTGIRERRREGRMRWPESTMKWRISWIGRWLNAS